MWHLGNLASWGLGIWTSGDLAFLGFGDLGIWDLGIWELGIWGIGDLGIWESGNWGLGNWGIWELGNWGPNQVSFNTAIKAGLVYAYMQDVGIWVGIV